jgi:hypothetical protein
MNHPDTINFLNYRTDGGLLAKQRKGYWDDTIRRRAGGEPRMPKSIVSFGEK